MLWFDMLIFVIKVDLRSRADLAQRQGDSSMYIVDAGLDLPTLVLR